MTPARQVSLSIFKASTMAVRIKPHASAWQSRPSSPKTWLSSLISTPPTGHHYAIQAWDQMTCSRLGFSAFLCALAYTELSTWNAIPHHLHLLIHTLKSASFSRFFNITSHFITIEIHLCLSHVCPSSFFHNASPSLPCFLLLVCSYSIMNPRQAGTEFGSYAGSTQVFGSGPCVWELLKKC